MGKTIKRDKRDEDDEDYEDYETVLVLPGANFGSLLSPAGRAVVAVGEAMIAQREKEERRGTIRRHR